MRKASLPVLFAALLMAVGGPLHAQTIQQATFDDAVRRAVENHPSVQRAAADILRAEAVVQQVRGRTRPSVGVSMNTSVIAPITRFGDSTIVPRTQTQTMASVGVPLYMPISWAERNQAADQVVVSQRAVADARRQIAMATGQAYLSIITQRRVLELNERALENARAHYRYADQRFQGGIGSRLPRRRARLPKMRSGGLASSS